MSTVNYDTDEINALIEDATRISTGIEEINQGISSSYNSLDSRVQRQFSDIFSNLNRTNRALQDELGDVGTYGTWLGDTLNEFGVTDKYVTELTPDIKDIGRDVQTTGPGSGDASKHETYKINPEIIGALPPSEQEAIKQKLKELGFSDDEIKGIINGEISVDKATLEALSTELANIAKTHPEVRTELKKLYGFDIFNADGSINKDKLALAMIMDGKNPNDQYDLAAFLKKYGINSDGIGTGGEADTSPDAIIGGIDPVTGKDGVDATDIENIGITGTDGLLDGVNVDNPDLMGDSTSLLAGSLGNTDGIVPKKGMEVKKGSIGAAGLGIAGIGGLAAAAGGLAMVGKKKDEEEEEENEEASDEENDIEILENEDEVEEVTSGIEGIIAEELALSERNNTREEAKKVEEQKAFVPEAAIGEEIKPKRKNDKDRSWLYGLGIGLAGAALASDDDDEEEEEEAY